MPEVLLIIEGPVLTIALEQGELNNGQELPSITTLNHGLPRPMKSWVTIAASAEPWGVGVSPL